MSDSITANYAEQIDQLTKEREDLQIKFDERGVALEFSELACERITKERDQLAAKCATLASDIRAQDQTIYKQSSKLAELMSTINEAWNALDNGRRKHHTDPLNGGCILGCQACAVDKLKHALSDQCGVGWLSPEKKKVLVGLIQRCDDYLAGAASFLPTRTEFKQALEGCK